MLIAHQGGWDEILLVLVPIGLFAFLLYVANKRAAKLVEADEREPQVDEQPSPDPRD